MIHKETPQGELIKEQINLKLKGKWISWVWKTPEGKISRVYSRNFMLRGLKGGKK